MTRTIRNYEPKFMREFYSNYTEIIKIITSLGKDNDTKKQTQLNMIWVWEHEIDISIKLIFNALFRNIFKPIAETLKYNFWMNNLK